MHSSQITAIIVALLTVIGCAFSSEPLLLLLVGGTLIIGLLLLWSDTGIPMLLLPFLLQWLSVATKPISAVFTGGPVNELADFGGDLNAAATFGSLALIALAVGMRLGMMRSEVRLLKALQADVAAWSQRSILLVASGLMVTGHVMTLFAWVVPGLTELLLAVGTLTYCGLFMLLYWSLRTGKLILVAWSLAAAEILFGLTGFFGTFRTALFAIAVVAMCAQPRFKAGAVLFGVILAVPAFFLMVFWSSVKSDYRLLLNNNSQTQTVQQPLAVRIEFLTDRAQKFDGEQFSAGVTQLLSRISYIDFLSMTLDYVPTNMPHENGQRTFASIVHIFTPRVFFPSKPPLESDTVVTARYTGLSFTNYTYASISLGYLGEAYVDFGWPGAIVFMLVFGAIIGRLMSIVLEFRTLPMILNAGLALIVTIPIWYFETALIKVIGGFMAAVIVVLILQRLVFPTMLSKYAGMGPRPPAGRPPAGHRPAVARRT